MRNLRAFDLVVLGYILILTLIVGISRPGGMWVYLSFHALAVILIALVVHADIRYGGRLWGFVRHWYVVPIVLASFREIHFLMPEVHPYGDGRHDHTLAGIDAALFGDVHSAMMSAAHPLLVDALHLCYWSYFGLVIAPGVVLHARGRMERFRECIAVIVGAMYLSYLGYFVAPAVGPHHYFAARPPELDGWAIGGMFHRALMAAEGDMPDAFPSGHALVALASLFMAWRHCRGMFWGMLLPATGCVLATVVLRYHYVTDVAASLMLLPAAIAGGIWLDGKVEGARGTIGAAVVNKV